MKGLLLVVPLLLLRIHAELMLRHGHAELPLLPPGDQVGLVHLLLLLVVRVGIGLDAVVVLLLHLLLLRLVVGVRVHGSLHRARGWVEVGAGWGRAVWVRGVIVRAAIVAGHFDAPRCPARRARLPSTTPTLRLTLLPEKGAN